MTGSYIYIYIYILSLLLQNPWPISCPSQGTACSIPYLCVNVLYLSPLQALRSLVQQMLEWDITRRPSLETVIAASCDVLFADDSIDTEGGISSQGLAQLAVKQKVRYSAAFVLPRMLGFALPATAVPQYIYLSGSIWQSIHMQFQEWLLTSEMPLEGDVLDAELDTGSKKMATSAKKLQHPSVASPQVLRYLRGVHLQRIAQAARQ